MTWGLNSGGAPIRRLAIVRHGITDHNASTIWQGHLDTSLNATGQAQAHAAARALSRMEPVFVRSSDLRRARHTAEAIAAACGLELVIDERLREIDVGAWQGMAQHEVVQHYSQLWEAINGGQDLARGEHGESVADVVRRARPAVDDAIAALPEGELGLLVTHGVTARALVADLIGLDQTQAWTAFTGLRNCHWALLHETPTGWRLAHWNDGPTAADGGDFG
ncbi:putative phosphoglycerate mutase [Kineosphaera limosa]|uniref:Phosphoglycerate mutase family protein n=1 Tax=Kineosphaera limosa NBRC 100340 TaxID=1184609 RepID=K6WT97_9MICO|nr:histidine phosphatase family protein [Kineosphaera limosa]NYD99279.1 putative phosphoglycerate mutase [Kineosphaera limosa]GAB97071.1 phosphoglycerate mutase family protein [Kineosphaera limosa NBRC 100340]